MTSQLRSENICLHSSRNLLDTPNRILPAGRWTGVQGDPAWSRRERWSQGVAGRPRNGWGYQISPQPSSGMISIVVGVRVPVQRRVRRRVQNDRCSQKRLPAGRTMRRRPWLQLTDYAPLRQRDQVASGSADEMTCIGLVRRGPWELPRRRRRFEVLTDLVRRVPPQLRRIDESWTLGALDIDGHGA